MIERQKHTALVPKTPLRFMWFVSKPHKKYFYGALVAVTFAEVCSTSVPFIFKSIIDTAQKVLDGGATAHTLWFWAIVYPCVVAFTFLSWRLAGFMGLEWVTRLNATAYQTLFAQLVKHSHSYFSNRFAGSLSSKVTHASEGTQSLAEAFVWNYYSTVLSIFLTLGFLASTSTLSAGIFLLLILILIPLNIYLVMYRRTHVVTFSEQSTKARGYAVDAITNMSVVRQFSRTHEEETRFANQIHIMRKLNVRQWRISEWGLSINNVIIVIFEAIIIIVAVKLWVAKTITTGDLVMITTLMMSMQHTLVFIGNNMNGFIRRYGDIQEGLGDIVIDYEVTDGAGAQALRVPKGEIVWSDVRFTYEENTTIFDGFNLTIKAGERVGLVGQSGAGKTTFVSLLLRQHDIEGGSICIDGQNIAEVTQNSLREHIAVVPQEPSLFHRTIRENIIYGKPDATQEEIEDVAQKAEAHEFIMSLPHGYDTMVGERGVKLSGGQKQRIAIARAMLKNAPLLVLDEATSALDSESEVAIQKALHVLMEGKTVIAIAHRLSTLREMDRIIVLEKGKIVEDGTHQKLVHKKGMYARLWKHQAGGFLKDEEE